MISIKLIFRLILCSTNPWIASILCSFNLIYIRLLMHVSFAWNIIKNWKKRLFKGWSYKICDQAIQTYDSISSCSFIFNGRGMYIFWIPAISNKTFDFQLTIQPLNIVYNTLIYFNKLNHYLFCLGGPW